MLVDLRDAGWDVRFDIRYATAACLGGRPVYRHAACFLHADAAQALGRAVTLAARIGWRLVLFDGYRPPEAQALLWQRLPDPRYVADPKTGSPHARGVAIDLTAERLDGGGLDMGTGFDVMTPASAHGDVSAAPQALGHRAMLAGVMASAGFEMYRPEWWHYHLPDWRRYPALADGAAVARFCVEIG